MKSSTWLLLQTVRAVADYRKYNSQACRFKRNLLQQLSSLLFRGEPGSCWYLSEPLSTINKLGWVKEFRSLVGLTGPSAYLHAGATGIIHPADWLCSTKEGMNWGRTSKSQAMLFKEHSFTLSGSNYTTPAPRLCLCVWNAFHSLPSLAFPVFPPTPCFSYHFSVPPLPSPPSPRLCLSSSLSVFSPSGYHICRLFPLEYISWMFRL